MRLDSLVTDWNHVLGTETRKCRVHLLAGRGARLPSGGRTHRLAFSEDYPMSKEGKRGREAGTGRFIPVQEAQRRKKTAVVETFKKDKNGRPRN